MPQRDAPPLGITDRRRSVTIPDVPAVREARVPQQD